MSAFYDNQITDIGRKLIVDMQIGAKFSPTKIVVGSGYMPPDKTTRTMTDVVEVVKEITLNKSEKTIDGDAVFGGVLSNAEISKPFYFRELALYAKVTYPDNPEKQESEEVLYSYGNAKENAELIPVYESGNLIERQLDLIVYIGNDTDVSLQVASGIYVDMPTFTTTVQRIDTDIEKIREQMQNTGNVGEPTDDDSKQTVFGKIAGVLKKVIGIDDKVGTAADTAAQATLFGKIKGITDNVSGNLKPMSDKIGQPADNETTQTVFGKIADLKKFFSDKAVEILNKIVGVDNKVGTSGDSSSSSTLFGRLKKVQETTDTINTSTNTVNSKIGASSDSSSSTLFGAIATHKKVIDEINTKLGPLYTDVTIVGTGNKITDFLRALSLTQGTASDVSYATVFGCLRNLCKHFGLIDRYGRNSVNFDIKTNAIADYHNITIPKTKGNCFKIHTFQPEYNTNIRIKATITGKAENMCFYVMNIVPANLMDIADTSVIPFDFQKTFSVYNQPLYDNAQHTQTATMDIILPVVQGRIYHFLTSGVLYDDNTLSSFEICYF